MKQAKLRKDEELSLHIRSLFESLGFRRTNVSEFEEYDFYVDYRNFLQSSNVITFMNAGGQLLVLRPDVTLSIVKNSPPEANPWADKVYYMENVYRFAKENREYYRVSQMGVEALGGDAAFENVEVVSLALESLSAISDEFRLTVSHMGFAEGLLSEFHFDAEEKSVIYQLIYQKNIHDLRLFLEKNGLSEEESGSLTTLISLSGRFSTVLEEAKKITVNTQMEAAILELETLYRGLSASESQRFLENLCLDFSVVNDLNYYNGLIFSGYVSKIHKVILVGGRYDKLMESMGKERGGIGFALSLDDIHRKYGEKAVYEVDTVVFYESDVPIDCVEKTAQRERSAGCTVRAEQAGSWGQLPYNYKKALLLEGQEGKEVTLSC